jgi:hypothetical protein
MALLLLRQASIVEEIRYFISLNISISNIYSKGFFNKGVIISIRYILQMIGIVKYTLSSKLADGSLIGLLWNYYLPETLHLKAYVHVPKELECRHMT